MSELKTAIITGAGSGVGRATALRLAEQDYNVALVGRTTSKLEDTIAQAAQRGIDNVAMTPYSVDLTDADAVASFAKQVTGDFPTIDVLANVAGYASLCSVGDIDAEHWRTTVDTNLSAVVLLTAALWPTFSRQKSGVVVNVSSLSSIDPFPGFAMYAASKAGLNMFTRVTADEGKRINLRAVGIAPGAIETEMLRNMFDEKKIPKDNTLSPDDVAAVICDCVSGERDFEPGETIELHSP